MACLPLHTEQHLYMVKICLQSKPLNFLQCGVIQPFPTIRTRKSGIANLITIDVFCYYRNTNNGSKMVVQRLVPFYMY